MKVIIVVWLVVLVSIAYWYGTQTGHGYDTRATCLVTPARVYRDTVVIQSVPFVADQESTLYIVDTLLTAPSEGSAVYSRPID